jgi:type IV secretion system protein TrbI
MTDSETGYVPPESAPPIDLRAPTPRVKRVSRVAVATVVAGLGVLVAFALIAALRQPDKTAAPIKSSTQLVLPADALSDLPTDYAAAAAAQRRRDVPKLGEPIGGEFGAAQLDAQNEAKARSMTATDDPVGKLLADMALARLKRRAAARDAKPDFGDHPSSATAVVASAERPAPGTPTVAGDASSRSTRDQDNRQDDKREFARSHRVAESASDVLTPANGIYLGAGTLIPAVLLTGINSDLPGMITAQVAEPVYDTVTGKHVLIPQGSTLIGEYDSRITFGQERVLFVWTKVRFPNGSSLNLDGMPGTDLSGYAGVGDQVDNHWWRLAKGVVLGSVLGAAAQQSYGGGLSAANPSLGQLAAAGAAQNINNAGQQIVQKNLQVQPTLVIRPGQRVAVFVTKDITLPPYRG